jgi:hypothetical protein
MSESSKEQFRKYLESAGAIDVLVKGKEGADAAPGPERVGLGGRGGPPWR